MSVSAHVGEMRLVCFVGWLFFASPAHTPRAEFSNSKDCVFIFGKMCQLDLAGISLYFKYQAARDYERG